MLSRLRILLCCGALCLSACSTSAQRAERIGCARHQNPRTAQICRAIAEEMEFKWMGHAVPAPGYKVTAQTLVRVYCRLGLTKSDAPALKVLTGVGPASDDLLILVGEKWVDRGNIFSPESPSYVLKGGCPAD